MTTEVVSPFPVQLGEGPYWDPRLKLLTYVDITGGDVVRLNPEYKEFFKVHVGGLVSFAIPRTSNPDDLIIGRNLSLELLNWKSSLSREIIKVDQDTSKPETRLNDGKCDALGRLWAGTMFNVEDIKKFTLNKAAFYSLDREHHLQKHLSNVSLSNGITWTSDNQTMYYIDSMLREVSAFRFDLEKGEISDRRTAVNFNNFGEEYGYPDGMTIDTTGKLWIACYDGGRVVQCDPETGKLLSTIQFPATKITSCCFGGKALNELYVTSVSHGLTDAELKQQPLAGHVFKVANLDVQGSPDYTFAG